MERMRRGLGKRGLTLVEVLVAGIVLLAALPPLINSLTTVWRLEAAQANESHGTHLAHVVFESVLHRMYNGRPVQSGEPAVTPRDPRGYGLNDTQAERRQKYAAKSYLQFFLRLRESGTAAVSSPDAGNVALSQYFDRLVQDQDGPLASGPTETSHPELVAALKNFRIDVDVQLHLDDVPPPPPGTPRTEPAVDMARLKLDLTWSDRSGAPVTRSFRTRLTRYLFEDSPLNTPP